jgi:EpsI family protein
MLGEIAVLNRLGHESGTWRQLFGIEFPAASPRDARIENRKLPGSFVAACLLLLTFTGISFFIQRPVEIYPARATFTDFPMKLGAWSGRPDSLEGVYMDTLKLDDYLLADYVNGGGPAVNLYMTYYNSQRKGAAFHSPRWCLPGGGWRVREFDRRPVTNVTIDGRPLRVNRYLVELGNQRELVYYWFQQRGRIVTDEYVVKWYLFWDALTRHRTDGGMVRLIVAIPPGASEEDADRRLTDLAGRVAPSLTRYVPD